VGADVSQINTLTRREIEAHIAGPLINAFIEDFGRGEVLAVVNRVIKSLAHVNRWAGIAWLTLLRG